MTEIRHLGIEPTLWITGRADNRPDSARTAERATIASAIVMTGPSMPPALPWERVTNADERQEPNGNSAPPNVEQADSQGMEKISLTAVARQHLDIAKNSSGGRSAHTVYGGHEHALRQTLIALNEGSELAEHESPGEATLQVLQGRVQLVSEQATWDGMAGDHLVIPNARHSLRALSDSVVLLTVVK